MQKPRGLREGDTISIVAPASPITREKIQPGLDLLTQAGFKSKLGSHLFCQEHYLAGTDEERASDLQVAFDDPETQAVWCARGGYGCARLIPHLDVDRMAETGKMLIGFSDVTSIHLALLRRGMASVHGPMAISFVLDREPWVHESFRSALAGSFDRPPGAPTGHTLVPGVAEGEVVGGCLCLLTDSLATPDTLDCEGRILLIEDVDENPHRVDAMLTHLRLAGCFDSVAGVVVGEMTGTDDREDSSIGGRQWREIVADRLGSLSVPVIVNYPFGHLRQMLTLALGLRARLDAETGTLSYLESF